MKHVLAIDQGTTSSRAILFDDALRIVTSEQQEFTQHFPDSGWVEHDPDDIWQTTLATCRAVLDRAPGGAQSVAAIGITNQRETTLVWDRETGDPVHRAIVWQDRRTAGICRDLKARGLAETITARTGLLLDPYFSGTKVKWILDRRRRAKAGRGGETAVRHGGQLPDLAADRRQAARNRRHQRRPHVVVRHRQG